MQYSVEIFASPVDIDVTNKPYRTNIYCYSRYFIAVRYTVMSSKQIVRSSNVRQTADSGRERELAAGTLYHVCFALIVAKLAFPVKQRRMAMGSGVTAHGGPSQRTGRLLLKGHQR